MTLSQFNAGLPSSFVIFCPSCRSVELYSLADGRHKCRRCKKKFTPHLRKRRLSNETICKIFRSFWAMVPAAKGAEELGINRKTMQSYYTWIRRHIASNREQSIQKLLSSLSPDMQTICTQALALQGKEEETLLLLAACEQEIWVLFPESRSPFPQKIPFRPSHCLWTSGGSNQGRFKLMQVQLLSLSDDDNDRRVEQFWRFARQRMRRYRGGFKKNFPLFIREMEFRFNNTGAEGFKYLWNLFAVQFNTSMYREVL